MLLCTTFGFGVERRYLRTLAGFEILSGCSDFVKLEPNDSGTKNAGNENIEKYRTHEDGEGGEEDRGQSTGGPGWGRGTEPWLQTA